MLNVQALEQDIQKHMQTAHVPGLALAIVQDREVIYSRGFGLTSVEDGGLPVTPQTLFRIGSITKSMTTTAIMRLVESGQLELDRPVREYVPWLTFSEEDAAERITLRRLLSHSAGLPTSHTPFGRRTPGGLEEYVREDVPQYPFVAPPGKLYSYSNPGIRIAGYIPNCLAPLIVITTMAIPGAIMAEAGLSFIGLGVPPPNPSWGQMLYTGRAYIRELPWLVIWPGLAIFLTVLSFNLFGDRLRDALDPYLKR